MSSVQTRTTKPKRKPAAPQQQSTGSPAQQPHTSPLSPGEDVHSLIESRAYERFGERGYQHGYALDDWLKAEREVLGQIPAAS